MKLLNKIGKFFNYLAKYNTLKLHHLVTCRRGERVLFRKEQEVEELREEIENLKEQLRKAKKELKKHDNKKLERKYKNVRSE